jgi:hypothetical protein
MLLTISISISSIHDITNLEVFLWIFLLSFIPVAICAWKYFGRLLDRSKSSSKMKEVFNFGTEKKYVYLTIYCLGLRAILNLIYDKTNVAVLMWIALALCVPALIFASILFARYLTRNRRKTKEIEKES